MRHLIFINLRVIEQPREISIVNETVKNYLYNFFN